MKKLFYIWLLLVLATAAQAAPVLPSAARQKAQSFLADKGRSLLSGVHRAPGRGIPSTSEADTASPYYVFNAQDGQGFVIISGDDRTDEVLGYADSGTFDESQLPDNLKAWLEGYAEAIEALDGQTHAFAPTRLPAHNAVAPLIRTSWNQMAPYYYKCPIHDDSYCVTGCVATAMAQIMYYHKWPTAKVPAMDSYGTVTATSATTIEWSKMKLSYGDEQATDPSAVAVATLMRLCGQSVKMQYGSTSSAAYSTAVPVALKNIFGYSPGVKRIIREDYTIAEWDALIYNEMAKRRPVLYSGQSSKKNGYSSGHAFIIDGFDGGGYYHINWGWSGDFNGYFKLHITNPENNTKPGSTNQPDGYTFSQDAIIGIEPPTGQPVDERPHLTSTELTFESTTVTANFYNRTGEQHSFNFGYGYVKSDGSITCLYQYPVAFDLPVNFGVGTGIIKTDLSAAGLADGTYTIVSISKLESATRWERSCGRLYLLATVKGGVVTLNAPSNIVDLTATSITFPRINFNYKGFMQKVVAQVKNKGDEFFGPIYLFASTTNQKGSVQNYSNLAVEAGATDEVDVWFTPSSTGTYNVWLTTDEAGKNVIGQSKVTIIEPPVCTLELVSYTQDAHLPVRLTATVKNTGNAPYLNNLIAFSFPYVPGEYVYSLEACVSPELNLNPGETTVLSFSFSKDLEMGKKYYLRLRYYPKHGDDTLKELFTGFPDIFTPLEGLPTEIQAPIREDETDAAYYTLDGMRISGKPTQKGIYLHGGKKVVVR